MTTINKPVWAEGVLLGQQHFQQWQNYIEHYQWLQLRIATTYNWGLQQLEIDEEILSFGEFRIKKCVAIFPNGKVINYKENSTKHLSCKLTNDNNQMMTVYLAVANNEAVTDITGYGSIKHAAWTADYQVVADLYDVNRSREVMFAKQNLQLFCNDIEATQFHYIKIAEVIKKADEQYHLVKEFIPPLTCLKATTVMVEYLRVIVELISAKTNTIQTRRQQFQGDAIEFGQSDLTHFLLLLTLNNSLVVLQHVARDLTLTPQYLYIELVKLAGSLCSFSLTQNVLAIPSYQHADLYGTFTKLKELLRSLLNEVLPTHIATLRLHREQDTLYCVENIDSLIFNKVAFFIAVNYLSDTPDWITLFVKQIKLSARSNIHILINSALTGVKIVHVQRPPHKLPIKAGYEYFYIEPNGEFWQQIQQERSMALFLPYHFVKAHIELITVKE